MMFLQTFQYCVKGVGYNAEHEYNLIAPTCMGSLLTAWHMEGMQVTAWVGEDGEYASSSSTTVHLLSYAYLYT